jgi:glutamine synthetase
MIYKYIWLDGYTPEQNLRSKIQVAESDEPPIWSFDGSSTQQAEGGQSDCVLKPVSDYKINKGNTLVMCDHYLVLHT